VRQSRRFDPRGDYIRRWVPELATLSDAHVHEPWRLDAVARGRLGYVAPLVDHAEAAAAFRARRV